MCQRASARHDVLVAFIMSTRLMVHYGMGTRLNTVAYAVQVLW